MAKRQANGATNSLDKKFEIDTDTFVVVTNFNGHLLVHIRNTQHGTDVHKKNKRCNNGGTTRQRSLYTIEKHGSNQHAIKVNLSLIF